MKKFLLPENGNFYKANLHCHTTCSDADFTPEEVKEAYKNEGYSIVAYTDHEVLLDRSHLCDEEFLALNGVEYGNVEPMASARVNGRDWLHTCHICMIALDEGKYRQVCYNRNHVWPEKWEKHRAEQWVDENEPDYEKVFSPEGISDMMKKGRAERYFVIYNHPTWSCDTYDRYSRYEGMHAMEMYNYSSYVEGYDEYNPKIYDDILRTGKRIFCVGSDDNHDRRPLDDPMNDSFGAFTVIKAEKLEYKAVTDALLAGNFYASQAPEIKELYFEDGMVHIKTSPAKRILINTGRRRAFAAYPKDDGFVTEASFEVFPEDVYIRLTVEDEKGLHANTNAYFTDTLF